MVLYAVDEFRRMLQTDTNGNTLCLDGNVARVQRTIDVARRVSGGKNHSIGKNLALICSDSGNLSACNKNLFHASLETHFATTLYYAVAHILYHTRQFVCTNMRMRIGKDGSACTMLAEYIEDSLDVSAFLATCV